MNDKRINLEDLASQVTEIICGPSHSFEIVKTGTVSALRAEIERLKTELKKKSP